jgi:hypothetical protein
MEDGGHGVNGQGVVYHVAAARNLDNEDATLLSRQMVVVFVLDPIQ